jgi:hypothetical protein
MKERLHVLFFEDHLSWMAMHATSIVVSVLIGFLFSLSGAPVKGCVIATCVTACFVVLIWAYRYSQRAVSIRYPAQNVFARRSLLLSIMIGAAEWAFEAALGNVTAAVMFAQTAEVAVSQNRDVSLPRIAFSKAAIESHLTKASGDIRARLLVARALLSSAQVYARIKRANPIYVPPGNQAAVEPSNHTQWMVGESRTTTNLIWAGTGPFIRTARDSGFDSLTFKIAGNPIPSQSPICIEVVGSPSVIVKNCTIMFFSQNLAGITWFDVLFEGCTIEVPRSNVILVNVSFNDCTILCDEDFAKDNPKLCSGNASNVTLER